MRRYGDLRLQTAHDFGRRLLWFEVTRHPTERSKHCALKLADSSANQCG